MLPEKKYEDLLAEVETLKAKWAEAQDCLDAIRGGDVDALVIHNDSGQRLYSLQNADHAYRAFIEKMKEGAVTIDRRGIIIYSNTQFASMVDLPLTKVIGNSFINFIPSQLVSYFKKLQTKGWQSDSKGEIYLIGKKRKLAPFLISLSVLELYEQELLSIVITDLSRQKDSEEQLRIKNDLLEEARREASRMNEELEDIVVERTRDLYLSREHFKFLADNIPVIVWTSETDGNAAYFNKQWYEYTGLSFDESKADGYKKVIHPDDLPLITTAWANALSLRSSLQLEYRIRRASDGQYRCHLVKGEPFKDDSNNIIAWFGTSTDIEDQKRRLDKKDEFMSTASHELKTPLSSVKGYVQLIARKKSLPPDVDQYVAKANESISKLQHLINNLLDVSKISAGRLKFGMNVIDLSPLINSCIQDCKHLYATHNIRSEVGTHLLVLGNPERLEQVIMNLISNAVKYSPGEKDVLVCAENKNRQVKVSVQDFGIGLSHEQQHRVFERFYRVEANRFSSGLGIGLYISSEIIKEHHGTMHVHSKPKEGSIFSFSLDEAPMPS